MLSRENAVIGISMLVALVGGAAVYQYTDFPSWVTISVLIGLGVVAPTAINEYARRSQGQT